MDRATEWAIAIDEMLAAQSRAAVLWKDDEPPSRELQDEWTRIQRIRNRLLDEILK